MDSYTGYVRPKEEFVQALGYSGKWDIPGTLVCKLAGFIDAHPTDMMTSYYAGSLLAQFYRRRTTGKSVDLFNALNSSLQKKSALIDLFLKERGNGRGFPSVEKFDMVAVWAAIHDLADGYAKANYIGTYSYLFTDDIVRTAYQAILAMPDVYKTRALAGLFPRVDRQHKAHIFSYLSEQFRSGAAEAVYCLKLLFPYLDGQARSEVIALHLGMPELPEAFIAYLIIRNAHYLRAVDANRLAARARNFQSDYLRNRCLLQLAAYLPAGEIDELFGRFIIAFNTQESNSSLIHNLYHFGAALSTLERSRVIDMALEKIARLDDSQEERYSQKKYGEMLFILPHLTQANRAMAHEIAETVRGRYRKSLSAKLEAHFAQSKNFCARCYAPVCY
ncbi:hypothetical protein RCH09_003605 [Actimicrobium sp. GrIS 1.19]|uniref:hypothetical protein n=1 Tax=Actimicrobium sp. GrIS 1.19 TaxID=3071708 RepID=UPI002E085CBA|nr:hypothetical protein [Actimicrobium sp. GrIS 1.19]